MWFFIKDAIYRVGGFESKPNGKGIDFNRDFPFELIFMIQIELFRSFS